MKKVSVCIVNYNDQETILKTIGSLLEYTKGVTLSIYVSDNQSTDRSVEEIKKHFPSVTVLENKSNNGFSAGNNAVLDRLDSDYHAIVNPDIEVTSDVLTQMVDYMEQNSDIGILTPKILNFDGTEQFLPKRIPKFRYLLGGRLPFAFMKKYRREFTMEDMVIDKPVEIDFCTGCFMLVRTDLFRQIRGFDERYFMYFEDADLTRKVQKYKKTVFHPDLFVYHRWHRADLKNIKLLMVHISSMIKYFWKWK